MPITASSLKLHAAIECPQCRKEYGRVPPNQCRAYIVSDIYNHNFNLLYALRHYRTGRYAHDLIESKNKHKKFTLPDVGNAEGFVQQYLHGYGMTLFGVSGYTMPRHTPAPTPDIYIDFGETFGEDILTKELVEVEAQEVFGQSPGEDLSVLFPIDAHELVANFRRDDFVASGGEEEYTISPQRFIKLIDFADVGTTYFITQQPIAPGRRYDAITFCGPAKTE
jgi:hypothetical protein